MKNKIYMEIEEVLYFVLTEEEIITEQQISYGNCSGGYIAVQQMNIQLKWWICSVNNHGDCSGGLQCKLGAITET